MVVLPLVTTKEMLIKAREESYAVGAFNANNIEMAQGIVSAAEEEEAPVIIQVSQSGGQYAGFEELGAVVKILARKARVPVALHLDHGTEYKYNLLSLRYGFTSLMFDGSQLDFEENIKITSQIVKAAHSADIPVEAELGKIPKNPDEFSLDELKQFMTEPEEALEFVRRTGVDSLAVSVGSMHKMTIQEAKLDIERIKKIKETVTVPLVLHGASGVTDESVVKAIKAGISKVNVHTHIAKGFTGEVRKTLNDNPEMVDLRKYLADGREQLKNEVKQKMRIFKASGKA
ncbi:MAG: class II fructose-bisphosphate aldolase [Halanaerobiaceae bacterium]